MLVKLLSRNSERVKILSLGSDLLFGTDESIDAFKMIDALRARAGILPETTSAKLYLTELYFELNPGIYVVVAGGCTTDGLIYIEYRKLSVVAETGRSSYLLDRADKLVTNIQCSKLSEVFQ